LPSATSVGTRQRFYKKKKNILPSDRSGGHSANSFFKKINLCRVPDRGHSAKEGNILPAPAQPPHTHTR
jgi:hypothetical protein